MILRLSRGVTIEPMYAGSDVDCRMLFMGDRYRQLLRAYSEVIHRLSRPGEPTAIAQYLRESAEIQQFYQIEEEGGRIGLVLRDEIFRTPASLDGLPFELRVRRGSHTRSYPLPLERFAALGHLVPLLTAERSEDEVTAGLRSQLAGEALAWAQELLSRLRADHFVEEAA